ncbi:papain-like cysteine protease family protein [Robbsia sp. KACC 23696]|uniref:papain-like cysteine protease family protein n=1 Tax=Robbsia sp. KACC 23696 TaxID=3149231 RepID=UPI00325AFDCB
MSIQTLSHTLQSVAAGEVSGEKLTDPISSTLAKVLNILSLGIYGAYLTSGAAEMENDLLDIGKALMKWDPDTPDIPVQMRIGEQRYELSNTPHGGISLLDRDSGVSREIEGVTIESLRDMVFSDLMNQPDFSRAMEHRIFQDSTTYVDIVGLKQERANACGEASRNMILAYHGKDYAPATNDRFIFEGSDADVVFKPLENANLSPKGLECHTRGAYTSEEIREGLKSGPLLCNLVGHFVVVYGVNVMLDRVQIFCPLLGARSASLKDFNAHLDWADYPEDPISPGNTIDLGDAPLTYIPLTSSQDAAALIFGKSTEPDFSSSVIDKMGVAILRAGFGIKDSWLKSPD